MELSAGILVPAARKAKPPPLWFVTNGDTVVGPVSTNLLLRGVAHDRVSSDCWVRERRWNGWRALEHIREVAALRREQARYGTVVVPKARFRPQKRRDARLSRLDQRLEHAESPGEALLFCLQAAVEQTGALVGAVHRRRPPHVGLVTSATTGPGMHCRLGHVVAPSDPAILLAERGGTLCEEPEVGTGILVRNRLGGLPAVGGVAMAPVAFAGRLYATIELGRPDHAFREADLDRLCRIARLAEHRLGVVHNAHQIG